MKLGMALLHRFFEIILSVAIPSVIVVALNRAGFLKSEGLVFVALAIAAIAFFVLNVLAQRNFYMSVLGDSFCYFASLLPYVVFILLTVILFFVNYNTYVWLFSTTKFLTYLIPKFSDEMSLLVFHSVGILTMLVSHIGLKKTTDRIKDEMKTVWNAMPDEVKKEMKDR